MNGEEIVRILKPVYELQLLLEKRCNMRRNPVRKVLPGARVDELLEMGLRRLARRHGFVRILVDEIIEREAAGLQNLEGTRQRILVTGE